MKPERIRWDILPQPGLFGWELRKDGVFVRSYLTQRGAISEARQFARFEWDTQLRPSEIHIHIHNRDGQIRDRDTYPRSSDPVESKG